MPLLHHETVALSLTSLIILGLPLAAAACARIASGMRKRNTGGGKRGKAVGCRL